MRNVIATVLLTALLSGCATNMSKKRLLDNTLYDYAKIIRWADFNSAASFLSPDIDDEHKPRRLDVQRLMQFSVSSYQEDPIVPGENENIVIQPVKIQFYNNHTKRERVIIDIQKWEYDEERKRWWLISGLPKITRN